jgi:hypothetical protein
LTGVLVGRTLLNGYQKVALVTVPDRICSSLAAATATSFINNEAGYRDGVAKIFVYEPGREREVARRIKELFLATNRLQTVLEDPALREYLTKVREVRLFTADL